MNETQKIVAKRIIPLNIASIENNIPELKGKIPELRNLLKSIDSKVGRKET